MISRSIVDRDVSQSPYELTGSVKPAMSSVILHPNEFLIMETEEAPAVWSHWLWWAAIVYAAVVTPLWVMVASQFDPAMDRISSATGCLLIGAVLTSAYTDLRWRLIPNWVTYPAILIGLGLNGFDSLTHYQWSEWLGTVGIVDSLLGLCGLFFGLLMVINFSGGGAGDVKLVGAIGAFLGFVRGGEAVVLSFVFCAVLILGWSLMRVGPLEIVKTIFRPLIGRIWPRLIAGPKTEFQQMLKLQLPLGPSFALGTLVVLLRDFLQENPQPFGYLFMG